MSNNTTIDGVLITLEGIDGSGKSTVLDELPLDQIQWDGDIVLTREPTKSGIGDEIRSILANDDSDPWTELFLFMADHAQHLHETVLPALANGALVISDRYIDSRCAYQATTINQDDVDVISYVEDLHRPWSYFPDTTIYLDVSPSVGAERATSGEKYETTKHLTRIKENYTTLREQHPNRFTVVDGEQPIDDVVADTVATINSVIP